MKKEFKIKKSYKELPPAEILRFGNEFVDDFILNEKGTEIPINAMRVIFNIVATLRNEQFQEDKQPQQLKLFEEEFASEHNSYAVMKIKNSLITRDSKSLKETYKFLSQFKYDWYSFRTSEGKKVSALGGLISNVFHEENGYTSFLISSYWIKKIIHIPEYNNTLYNLVYRIRSNKHIVFWFWLNKLNEEGTKVSRSKLNEMFNINYKDCKSLCKDFLKSIRMSLDKYSHKSFNYSIEGELIHIKPYAIKLLGDSASSQEVVKKVNTNYHLRYLKNRHQLTREELRGIIYIFKNLENDTNLLLKAYKEFSANCRRLKEKTTDYKGTKFIEVYQEFIRIEYLKTDTGKKYSNAFPRI